VNQPLRLPNPDAQKLRSADLPQLSPHHTPQYVNPLPLPPLIAKTSPLKATPSCCRKRGHLNFAQRGHFNFAVTSQKAGLTEKELSGIRIRHNLSELWAKAANLGLPIGDMPQWAKTLNSLHEFPYHLRYPTRVNVLVFPNAHETESELWNLIDTVRKGMEAL
jgi:hypothetical protein